MAVGRDPHAEGLLMIAFVLVCAVVMLTLAAIGAHTVWGWRW